MSLFEGKALVWWMDWSRSIAGNIANLGFDELLDEMDD